VSAERSFDHLISLRSTVGKLLHIHTAWHKLSIAHAGVNGNCDLVRDFPVRSSHLEVTGIIGTQDGSTPSHSGKTGSVIVNIYRVPDVAKIKTKQKL
jgi:hypothetical protein